MSLQYSSVGARINNSFVGDSVNHILDGIRTALLAAGWTELLRHKASAAFVNSPFYSGPSDGGYVIIGNLVYKFYTSSPPTDGSIPVLIGGSVIASFQNLRDAINANDPTFVAPFGGTFSNAPAFQGVTILAKSFGTAANNLTLAVNATNFGGWLSSPTGSGITVTQNGGWEMESLATPAGLKLRVRAIFESAPGTSLANVYISTSIEDQTSTAFKLNVSPVLTYRIIADPYQFFLFASASTAVNTSVSAGNPYLQSFLTPVVIASITGGTPIQVLTSTPHGLTTGQTISITEGKERAGVTATGTQANGTLSAGNISVTANNNFQNGDVVLIATGNTLVDGVFTVSNTTSTTFSLDNSKGGPNVTGTATGPLHVLNGTWTVTVIDATNFTLNGSNGSSLQTYIASSGLVAAPGRVGRAIWAIGSTGNVNLRAGLSSQSNAQFIALNSASYGILGGADSASPRIVMPGLAAQPLNFSNGCAIVTEPLIAAGPNGTGTAAAVFGQIWDAALITSIYALDLETNFDSHNYHLYAVQAGDANDYQGSLWLAIS